MLYIKYMNCFTYIQIALHNLHKISALQQACFTTRRIIHNGNNMTSSPRGKDTLVALQQFKLIKVITVSNRYASLPIDHITKLKKNYNNVKTITGL